MSNPSLKDCAGEVLDTVPLIMQFIRVEMRRSRGEGVSIPQFRVLTFLNRTEDVSLSAVADRVGLSLPAMSRLVDGLVGRNLVRRDESPQDRRRVTLNITPLGRDLVRNARAGTQSRLAEVVGTLDSPQRAETVQAMQTLRPVFLPKSRASESTAV